MCQLMSRSQLRKFPQTPPAQYILNVRFVLTVLFLSASKYMQNYVGLENVCFEKWVGTRISLGTTAIQYIQYLNALVMALLLSWLQFILYLSYTVIVLVFQNHC